MSYLQNAHHFNVNELNIVHNTGTAQASNAQTARESEYIDTCCNSAAKLTLSRDTTVLGRQAVQASAYDSAEQSSTPKCHPNTRKAVQGDIMSWISHASCRLMWLVSPAGCGKTTIAGSITENCDKEGLLAGSFFFSTSAPSTNHRSKWGLLATLAYQMANIEGYQVLGERIGAAVEQVGRSLFSKRLSTQMDMLILLPCREAMWILPGLFARRRVIIIDGLDEVLAVGAATEVDGSDLSCQERRQLDEADQVDVLSVLHQAASDPLFPFLVFIASRPEPVIRRFFSDKIHVKLFLDDNFNPNADIKLYLQCNFSKI
ncbi:hypothetical protein NMY22_g11106 [Coprinellus aureogranulatus]|nr:hypothetical protein NMY22_g11106 [Coprinellus aureogranulatus]